MNAPSTSRRPKRTLKPVVIALALALSGSAALAASMGDIVTTRADQNVDQQYGRDSVYAFSTDKKPLTPERTSGSHAAPIGSELSQQGSDVSGQQSLASNEPQSEALPAGSGYTDSETGNVGSGNTGSEWQTVYADDGISDGPDEKYSFDVPLGAPGEYSITLRVFDAAGNVGNSRVVVRK